MSAPKCVACIHFHIDGGELVCGHPKAKPLGALVQVATREGGHCGPTKRRFVQHAGRSPEGLKL